MKAKPLSNNIIVNRDEAESTSKGGILLPDKAKEKPQRGTVLAVGPGKPAESVAGGLLPMTVKVGDVVLFDRYRVQETEVDGTKVVILSEDEVLAIITK